MDLLLCFFNLSVFLFGDTLALSILFLASDTVFLLELAALFISLNLALGIQFLLLCETLLLFLKLSLLLLKDLSFTFISVKLLLALLLFDELTFGVQLGLPFVFSFLGRQSQLHLF